MPDDWKEIERLFHAAAELPKPGRAAFLERECAVAGRRDRVTALLHQAESGAGEFLDQLLSSEAAASADAAWSEPVLGERLGPYRIESLIGRGGMSDVYLARRDDREYDASVAIKILRRGLGLEEMQERFRRERQILARLEHPSIARLIDGGSTAQGLPYLVMELVEGVPVTEYAEQQQLTVAERCRILIEVCEAVSHAHRHLVVHRDLKPSNILAVPHPGVPAAVKLLDFGIAKLLEPGGATDSTETNEFFRPLTPDYASPEQVCGQPVTTATDVYQLGAVLFHLLTGRSPRNVPSGEFHAIERAVRETPVPKPSEANPERQRELAGDLDNIVRKAMEPEPARRYRSADELSADLRNYLEGRPVTARPAGVWYRSGKLLRRHPVTAGAVAFALVSAAAGMLGTLHQARQTEQRFQQVRKLANIFVFDIHDEIAELPGSSKVRRRIVATALSYLENLSKAAGSDGALNRELAAAYQKIAEVQGGPTGSHLGDVTGAMESFRRSEALLTDPGIRGQRESRQQLARLYESYGGLKYSQGDLPGAIRMLRQAREEVRSLLSGKPDDPETLESAGNLETTLSRMLTETRELDAAREAAESSLRVTSLLVERAPGIEKHQASLANAYSALGIVRLASGDSEGASKNIAQAVRIRESIANAQPDHVDPQRLLMVGYGHLGDILGFRFGVHLGDPAGARTAYQRAVGIAQRLTLQDKSDEKARFDLASAKLRLGSMLLDSGERDSGLRELTEAERINSALRAHNPKSRPYQANDRYIAFRLGCASLAERRYAAAIPLLRQARSSSQEAVRESPANEALRVLLLRSTLELAAAQAAVGGTEIARDLMVEAERELDERSGLFRTGWARPAFYHRVAQVHALLGEHAAAREWYGRSGEAWRAPSNPSALRRKEIESIEREVPRLGR